MAETTPNPSPSITESPWYWVYLFCTAGLVALVLIGPKYAARQSQIERVGQGRQRAIQNLSGETPTTAMSSEDQVQISLRPLYLVLAALLAAAWAALIGRHLRRRRDSDIRPSGTASHIKSAAS
jgi:hypothetical protein